MSEDCCGCDSIPIVGSMDPRELFDVRGLGDIQVTTAMDGGTIVKYVSFNPYTLPQINVTANPLRQVGQLFDFTWSVNIVPGREAITTRTVTPTPDPLPNYLLPFTLTVLAQKKLSRQTVNYFSVFAADTLGGNTTKLLSIAFVNNVFMGYSIKDGVSAGQELTGPDIAAFTATLADNIKNVYGGLRTFVVPPSAALQYLYFLYESGTTPINAMTLSGLPFPLVFIPGSISIVNPLDGSISANYSIVRSANKFGAGSLSLLMA